MTRRQDLTLSGVAIRTLFLKTIRNCGASSSCRQTAIKHDFLPTCPQQIFLFETHSSFLSRTSSVSSPERMPFTSSPSNSSSSENLVNPKQSKDYQLAFATLSSSYGFGGGASSLPPQQPRKNNSIKASPSSCPPPTPTCASYPSNINSPSRSQKDYQEAFAYLSSSFGFGGNGPKRKM